MSLQRCQLSVFTTMFRQSKKHLNNTSSPKLGSQLCWMIIFFHGSCEFLRCWCWIELVSFFFLHKKEKSLQLDFTHYLVISQKNDNTIRNHVIVVVKLQNSSLNIIHTRMQKLLIKTFKIFLKFFLDVVVVASLSRLFYEMFSFKRRTYFLLCLRPTE